MSMTATAMNTALTIRPEGFSFTATDANLGVQELGLRLDIDGQRLTARYGTPEERGGALTATGTAGNGVRVQTALEPVAGLNAVVVTHRLENTTARPLRISNAATGQFAESAAVLHGKGSWLGWDLRYCHTDNVRTERYPHCQMEYPYVRMLPVATTRLGGGEDQAFPALFIEDIKGGRGMVFAAATQTLNYPVFSMRKLTDSCDRGHRVHCPDDRAFTGVPLPEVLYVDFPAESPTAKAGVRQSVALFNWTDEPQVISVRRARLGHAEPVKVENFWTGERETFDGEFITKRLEARSAVLFEVYS